MGKVSLSLFDPNNNHLILTQIKSPFTLAIYYAIAIANVIAIVTLFYGVNINRNRKMGAQMILEPNGNRNRIIYSRRA